MSGDRNAAMIGRIQSSPVRFPFHFTIAGDTGAFPNPAGDAIFAQLIAQMEQLTPKPLFFANLGDFSGPGTAERHAAYLRLLEAATIPNICLMGNHDMDDAGGWDMFAHIHGPQNFQFAYGNTQYVAINCQPGTGGPRIEDFAYLEDSLKHSDRSVRIVLMHMPPNLNGHYAPHAEWGFSRNEPAFLSIVKSYRVRLVCCAHVIAYDYTIHDQIPYVISGGGGWGLCSDYGICQAAAPPYRGSFYHFVDIEVDEDGSLTSRVFRAFEGVQADPAYQFSAH
jgi:hypothetical protein